MSHAPTAAPPAAPREASCAGGCAPAGPAPAPPRPQVPAWRLVATLAVAGSLAGLLIVVVFQWAQPRILAHQAEVLRLAVTEVLAGPERTERFFVVDGGLVAEPPAGADTLRVERVFLGFDAADAPIGFAVRGAEPGFQDLIHVLFGYDPRTGRVLGMKVLDHLETPGLGDKIEHEAFVSGFVGALAPLVGVKPGAARTERDVQMVTGATISARTVVSVINNRIEQLHPVLESALAGGTP